MRINTACDSCGATGLYSGMCEGPGRAVVCLDCGGTGCQEIEYRPYEGRKRKRGIRIIQASRGRFLIGPMGGGGDEMTYVEFERRFPALRSPNDRR